MFYLLKILKRLTHKKISIEYIMVYVKRCSNCYIKECKMCKIKQEAYLFKKGSAKCNKCLYQMRKEYLKEYNKKYEQKRKERRRQQKLEEERQRQEKEQEKINEFMSRKIGKITVEI